MLGRNQVLLHAALRSVGCHNSSRCHRCASHLSDSSRIAGVFDDAEPGGFRAVLKAAPCGDRDST
jgi:hypothetical protein